ncbi:MAG: chemotaxis protein CheW [Gammaproteobacteria bacterium]|nr:chemotaxis protein CheW [Gammaproteobacteria bacterium]MDH4314216.1 chemotaxis protein CheW [Gammaproteobacteria bacterium]MDH5213247.1 chemotaxis protein CheW [Gammaproteobacteria bacterium]MDH5499484.1 chemotaxis protein CheW [Gammaproteobacteria bacterium]
MSDESEELYSLLVPLAEDRLIVPRACVAEVVRFGKADVSQGGENWMVGSVNWNGRALPVVSFEGMIGKDIPAPTGRTRIVVFYSTSGRLKIGYFGVLTQGFPQLVRVNRQVLRLDSADGWADSAPILCKVKMINEYPLIPDLEKIELMIAEETLQA